MSKRDWINMVLVFVDISSFVAGIQQHFTEKMSKIFGLIEIGIYEYIIIFLSIIAFLFIYNKEWTEKHLDELTGKAKREREEKEEKTKLDELLVLITPIEVRSAPLTQIIFFWKSLAQRWTRDNALRSEGEPERRRALSLSCNSYYLAPATERTPPPKQ